MRPFARLRRLFKRPSRDVERSEYNDQLAATAERLAEMRGDRVVAGPADSNPSSGDNVNAAVQDYGFSGRFSGESDALAGAADNYRPSSRRKNRKRQK